MNHLITVGDVLDASAITIGIIFLICLLLAILAFFAKGWNH